MNGLIKEILEVPEETQTLEFKRLKVGDNIVSKTLETIVAMSNAYGGIIVFGVDDPEKTKLKGLNRIFGIEEGKEVFDEIGREIQRIIPPIANAWDPAIIKVDEIGKTIALLKINKATENFHSINSHVWMRLLKGNKRLAPQEIIKLSYAKGFKKADRELVDVDLDLLNTEYFEDWRKARSFSSNEDLRKILFDTGLARKNEKGVLEPTRAAVMLFAKYPTNIMDTKCAIRIFQYSGTVEEFKSAPNLIGIPKTIDGPVIKLINDAHEYVLMLLRSGIEVRSGFVNKYLIPERAVKEAITNAIIHRDYHIKRDIEISIFEDRLEILSPGLFPCNITRSNIGKVRADGYRNDLLVKHLREFHNPPNLDRNEGVRAMRSDMKESNLYDPIFLTYPILDDSTKVVLLNEKRPDAWEKVKNYLESQKYITNTKAREITAIIQTHKMSRLFSQWLNQGLLIKVDQDKTSKKFTKYKLPDNADFGTDGNQVLFTQDSANKK